MATDYTLIGMGFTFVCALAFTILGLDSDDFPRAVFYEMFSCISWYATAWLFWGSGSDWVSIPWLFVGLALIMFVLVIFDSLQALDVYRKTKRGW